jgi:hypothetical protein
MKILLVDPPALTDDYDKAYPNIGLLQLVSYLRTHTPLTDADIVLLDSFHTLEDHLRLIEQVRPTLYGISFAFLTQRIAYTTINAVKRRFPDLLVIAGGPHPTSAWRDVLEKTAADFVAIGEGETLLADVVRKLLTGDPDFCDTPGLALRADGRVQVNPPRPVIENLDALPFPAWERIDFSRFTGQHYCRSSRQACIVISRGCPFRCTFCSLPVWRVSKPYVRLRSPENIAGEVDRLYGLGIREIKIVSDEINAALPWAKQVCRAIIALDHKDLHFQANLRAWPIDDELADLFRRMNLWLVHLGCESANDRVLAGIRKKISVRQMENCLTLLKRHGIHTLLFMMAFNLWEENGRLCWEAPAEVWNSLVWAWKQFLRGRISYMTWSIATPMPGAPLHDIAQRHGLQPDEQVLANWDRNKDYLGIDLAPLGVSQFARANLLRAGILSKACFMLASGRFEWRRNLFRIGILLRSFLDNRLPRGRSSDPTVAPVSFRAGVEG